MLFAVLAGCSENQARKDYDDFRARTAAEREKVEEEIIKGSLEDLSGRWRIHALLQGGIDLGLIMDFVAPEGLAEGVIPTEYTVSIWLWDQNLPLVPCGAGCAGDTTCNRFDFCEKPPLVITTTQVDPDGSFVLVADPLNLGTEVINSLEPVQAQVTMNSQATGPNNWCGLADGAVVSPLTLNLDGSTFSAMRHDPSQFKCQVGDRDCTGEAELADSKNYEAVYKADSFRCPAGTPGAPDMGVEPDMGDMGMGDGGGEVQRPESPDLSEINSMARDLTGNWIFSGKVNGALPLQLWLSLIYTPGPNAGSLDGALRGVMDEPGSEALATFSTRVEADGRFEIWLPGLDIKTSIADVNADILMGAVTVEGGFCGIAAGQVNSPPLGALNENTTFFASPWEPGTEIPMDLPDACP